MTEAEAIEAMARAISDKQCTSSIYDHPEACLGTPDCDCGMLAYAALAALRPYLAAQFAAGAEAMREASARTLAERNRGIDVNGMARIIRALPIPDRPTDTEPKPDARVARRP